MSGGDTLSHFGVWCQDFVRNEMVLCKVRTEWEGGVEAPAGWRVPGVSPLRLPAHGASRRNARPLG